MAIAITSSRSVADKNTGCKKSNLDRTQSLNLLYSQDKMTSSPTSEWKNIYLYIEMKYLSTYDSCRLIFVVLQLVYWKHRSISSLLMLITVDAVAPCVTRSSAAIWSTMQYMRITVLREERFPTPPSKCRENNENANIFYVSQYNKIQPEKIWISGHVDQVVSLRRIRVCNLQ